MPFKFDFCQFTMLYWLKSLQITPANIFFTQQEYNLIHPGTCNSLGHLNISSVSGSRTYYFTKTM